MQCLSRLIYVCIVFNDCYVTTNTFVKKVIKLLNKQCLCEKSV